MKAELCKIPGCRNEGRYCRLHLNYSVPVEKKINKVSDNHKETLKEYKKVRKEFLSDHPQCMAKLQGCKGKANQVHHMAGKSSPELYVNKKYFLSVCGNCHEILEKNPAFAKANGFSLSRLSKAI
jgi:hypothetical protein